VHAARLARGAGRVAPRSIVRLQMRILQRLELVALVGLCSSGEVHAEKKGGRRRQASMVPKHTRALATQSEFNSWVKVQVDADKTAFVRWIHSTS
jgi:hypothetical protein